MTIPVLLDEYSTAKYILAYQGEKYRFCKYRDLLSYLNDMFGHGEYQLSFDYYDN